MSSSPRAVPSSLNAWSAEYIDAQYAQYKADPGSVAPDLRAFFMGFELGNERAPAGGASAGGDRGSPLDRAVGSLAGGDLARARVLIDAALAIDRQQLGLALKAFLDSQAAATESRPQAHRAGPLAELLATTEPEAARRSL